ncbi:MAG: lasso peptide biosynthesis PqqD family chaperone [Anaerolineae bacterium]|jgi:predicted aldo/keto reductase-like oxidoreductase|nr:lasso peptide biosynthesis PqqD family chaperone [Anaerolineae bacterium]
MASLTSDSRVVRSEEFITSTVDNELVMMSLEKGTYYGLDAIGSQIWENIAAPTTIDALCQKLVDEFDVDPAQCQADVLAFLNELHREGMVRALN